MVEPLLIELIKPHVPQWAVQVAPDMVNMGAGKLVTVRAHAFPVQGTRGVRYIVDVSLYGVNRGEVFSVAREVLSVIENGVYAGKVEGVSSFRPLQLPSLTFNTTGGKSAHRVEFSVELVGRYLPQ